MKRLKDLGKTLGKSEQKKILGGYEPCSVTCGTGYYACCCAGACNCVDLNDNSDHQCSSGGRDKKSCNA